MRVELRSSDWQRPSVAGAIFVVVLLAGSAVMGPAVEAQGPVSPARTEAEAVPEALNFANGLFRARRFDLAVQEYQAFLATNPSASFRAEALYGLANAHHFLQEYAEARATFEQFLEVAPKDHPSVPTALFRVGELAYVLGDLPVALKALESYTKGSQNHRYQELAWPYLGDVRFQRGDLQGARAAYEHALSTFPDGRLSDRARLSLGRVLVRQGESKLALTRFRELLDRPEAPQRDEAFYQVGRLQLEAGAFEEAITAFSALEKAIPQSAYVARSRLGKAEALLALDRFDEMIEVLEPLRNDPSPELAARASYTVGLGALKQRRLDEAMTVLDEALQRFPETSTAPALLFRSAEAAERSGDLADALTRFERLVATYPEDRWVDDALLQAASLALKLGKNEQAIELARRVRQESNDGPLSSPALLIEARATLDAQHAEKAIPLLDLLLDREDAAPETAQAARYYLGLAYKAAGREEEAIRHLDELAKAPDTPYAVDALYLVGQGHFDAGRYEEAIAALSRFVEARPDGEAADHAMARIALGLSETGQEDRANETIAQLSERFPDSPVVGPTRLRVAETALAAEQWDRAEQHFRALAETEHADPNQQTRAWSGLGWALMGSGKLEQAIKAFDEVLKRAPEDPLAAEASYVRGRALRDLNRPNEAIEAFAWVVSHHPGSIDAPKADLARARLLVETGQPDQAISLFETLLDSEHPEPVEATDLLLAELAWALLDGDRVEEADQVFERLLREYPESSQAEDARLNLAESAFQAGQFEEVLSWLEPLTDETEETEPRIRQAALYRAGRTRVERQEWDEASQAFDRLVSGFPDGTYVREAGFWSAEVAFRRGDPEAAEAGFRTLIEATPEDRESESWLPTARLRLIQALVQQERWSDVLTLADSLKAEVPDLPQMADLDYARGRALQSQAPPQFEEAREAYQAVIDARKGGELAAMAQFMRGETFFHQKRYDEALREFLKVDILPSYDDAPKWQALSLLEAGKVYEQLDRWADAADIYERLRLRFPDEPASAEANRRLVIARGRVSGEAVGEGSGRRG
ncbi:tetratricopeptide repeat protein [Tautonia rosea]|uniref:tetratricopeptide repeat protein n=1 Tax=Tautonia rosea TaxID=2728037 RepID=UPI001472D13B|nr:tetratricopeptide repeat protein [Tautonia rosea]